MHSLRHIFALIALVAIAISSVAQTARQIKDSRRDFIYLSGAVGYESLLNQDKTIHDGPGAGLEIGVGYRMYWNHLLFQIGAEGKLGTYQVRPVGTSFPAFPMKDSQGDDFLMKATISDSRDNMRCFDLNVPLLLGGEWGKFYFLVGAKAGINVLGSAVTSSLVSTSGVYDRFQDEFSSMPNHQFYSNQLIVSGRQKIGFAPQVLLTGEVGLRLGRVYSGTGADVPYAKTRCYLAAFGEYGLLNMHKGGSAGNPITMEQQGDELVFQVSPTYNAASYADAAFRNYLVGLKFTIVFEMPKAKICVICRDKPRR